MQSFTILPRRIIIECTSKYYYDKSTFEDKYDKVSVFIEIINFFNSKSDCPVTSKAVKKKLKSIKNIMSALKKRKGKTFTQRGITSNYP